MNILDLAVRYYLEKCRRDEENEEKVPEEVHHVTYSLWSGDHNGTASDDGEDDVDKLSKNNMHLINLSLHSLTVDGAFEEA